MKNQIATNGSNKPLTITEFTELCDAEYKTFNIALKDEFNERKAALAKLRDDKVKEYRFMNMIFALNKSIKDKKFNPDLAIPVESDLAKLDYGNIGSSFTLEFWRKQYGDKRTIVILSDIMSYFLDQFEVKEKLTDVQYYQFSVKLMAAQPKLRILELVFVFNNALQGKYGPTYQRIGIDSILSWISSFLTDSSSFLETSYINLAKDESRGESPWIALEQNIKKYESEQRAKKEIIDKVWGAEKRKIEIDAHKNKLNSPEEL